MCPFFFDKSNQANRYPYFLLLYFFCYLRIEGEGVVKDDQFHEYFAYQNIQNISLCCFHICGFLEFHVVCNLDGSISVEV